MPTLQNPIKTLLDGLLLKFLDDKECREAASSLEVQIETEGSKPEIIDELSKLGEPGAEVFSRMIEKEVNPEKRAELCGDLKEVIDRYPDVFASSFSKLLTFSTPAGAQKEALSLTQFGESGKKALLECLFDPDNLLDVQKAAIIALDRFNDRETRDALNQIINGTYNGELQELARSVLYDWTSKR